MQQNFIVEVIPNVLAVHRYILLLIVSGNTNVSEIFKNFFWTITNLDQTLF